MDLFANIFISLTTTYGTFEFIYDIIHLEIWYLSFYKLGILSISTSAAYFMLPSYVFPSLECREYSLFCYLFCNKNIGTNMVVVPTVELNIPKYTHLGPKTPVLYSCTSQIFKMLP